ncbi:MAG: hypothetical protein IJ309_04885 [Clostridia bacterium]|nr:hypothetical protein [Clostridia bacterium]
MTKAARQRLITLIVLGALLVAGIIVAVVLSLNKTPEDPGDEENQIPIPAEGESTYANVLLMYPQISTSGITSIEITTKDSQLKFKRVWSKEDNNYSLRLEGLESVPLDDGLIASLRSYIGTAITLDPIRDATPEQMDTYGVSEGKYQAKYKITFEDDEGVLRYATVRIGDKAAETNPVFYAVVEGRDVIYRMQAGVSGYTPFEELLFAKPVDFLKAIIFSKFTDETNAYMGVDSFNIFTTTYEDADQNGTIDIKTLISIGLNERDKDKDTAEFFVLIRRQNGSVVSALADSEYLTNVFSILYTTFEGDKVVDVITSDTDLSQYGLEEGRTRYLVDATFSDGTTSTIEISKPIDGYSYAVSTVFGGESKLVVRLKSDNISFINEDNEYLLESYTATNTVLAGFYEYLQRDETSGAPGMKKITIKTKDYEEIFYTNYDTTNSRLSVTTEYSGLVFNDKESEDSFGKNQFANLYTLLLLYPMPRRINTMTDEERAGYMTEENMVYELIAERNDGKVLRYTYYKTLASYALAEYQEGQNSGGQIEWGEAKVVFDTTMEHIRVITDNYKKLMTGEEIHPDQIIY